MVPDPTAPAPLTETPSPAARAAGLRRRSGDARRLQILWVEDDATRDDAGRALLTARAAPGELAPAVIPASSAAGALAELRRGAFDVVLLDLDLPDSQGLATLATVRPHLGHAAVVVLAAEDDEEAGLAALQMGATDYLLKRSLDPLHL
ncbi:MAG TPA: response regulator, partial [Longimicrobiaceae bacterium]|nr:response regulator [Longimicrobiaceae bacterium]